MSRDEASKIGDWTDLMWLECMSRKRREHICALFPTTSTLLS